MAEKKNAFNCPATPCHSTTLINDLLGQDVLPSGVVPVTSIITAIVYGEQPRTLIEYTNSSSEDIDPEDIDPSRINYN